MPKGKRNYRFFFQFLTFLVLHMCNIFAVCLLVALKTTPLVSPPVIAAISMLTLIVLLIIPIGGLLVFHLVLISKGRTTNEHVTGKYRGMNFFTRGCCLNFMHLFFGSFIPQYKKVHLKKKKKSERNSNSNEAAKNGDVKTATNADDGANESASQNNSESESDHSNRGSLSDGNGNGNESNHLKLDLSATSHPHDDELLDVVLKNKKMLKNNRKTSVTSNSSSSSQSASMLNNKDKKSTQKA